MPTTLDAVLQSLSPERLRFIRQTMPVMKADRSPVCVACPMWRDTERMGYGQCRATVARILKMRYPMLAGQITDNSECLLP